MIIREIEEKDDKQIEQVIRICLMEFGGNRPGLAWTDSDLGCLSKAYKRRKAKYWVIEENGMVVGGCGIGPLKGANGVCELQKMYCLKSIRGTGISHKVMKIALDFAEDNYEKCYIETLSNMTAANKFYLTYGFEEMDRPLIKTEHYSCDAWYVKTLKK